MRSKLAMKIYDEYVNILKMTFSHYSVFLVPCIPFLCSIGSMFLVPVCWFVSSFIGFVPSHRSPLPRVDSKCHGDMDRGRVAWTYDSKRGICHGDNWHRY